MFEGERSGDPRWASLAQRVRDVATACADGSLERLRVVDGDVEIEVRRGAAAPSARTVATGTDAPAFDPPSRNGDADGRTEPALVRSDVVGILHLARPAVAEGALLDGERELAYIESLGVRNAVSSGGAGRVVGVLVADGEPVDYGQPLFAIER